MKLRSSESAIVESSEVALTVLAALALFLVLAARSGLFFVPFAYEGDYQSVVPPNLIDLVWLGLGLALYARSGKPTARVPFLLAGLLVITLVAGSIVIAVSTIILATGQGPRYEFYTQMDRYGGMGLGPNEAA